LPSNSSDGRVLHRAFYVQNMFPFTEQIKSPGQGIYGPWLIGFACCFRKKPTQKRTHLYIYTLFKKMTYVMHEIELRFPSLKDLISFKQQSQVKDLRIDTVEKSLTGKFPQEEVLTAMRLFKATVPDQQKIERANSFTTAAI
jgi:hypothetical protein